MKLLPLVPSTQPWNPTLFWREIEAVLSEDELGAEGECGRLGG